MKRQYIIGIVLAALLLLGGTSYLIAKSSHIGKSAAKHTVTRAAGVSTENATADTIPAKTVEQGNTANDGQQSGTTVKKETASSTKPSQSGNTARPSGNQPTPNGQPRNFGGEGMRDKFMLMRLFHGIGALDDSKTPLSSAQAKAILALMTPLRSQPTLTAEQASKTLEQLQAIFTEEQRTAIEQLRPNRRGEGQGQRGEGNDGQRPQGFGPRPDGQRPNGEPPQGMRPEGRPNMERPSAEEMANMNPFYTKGENPMAKRMTERLDAIFMALEAKAK